MVFSKETLAIINEYFYNNPETFSFSDLLNKYLERRFSSSETFNIVDASTFGKETITYNLEYFYPETVNIVDAMIYTRQYVYTVFDIGALAFILAITALALIVVKK